MLFISSTSSHFDITNYLMHHAFQPIKIQKLTTYWINLASRWFTRNCTCEKQKKKFKNRLKKERKKFQKWKILKFLYEFSLKNLGRGTDNQKSGNYWSTVYEKGAEIDCYQDHEMLYFCLYYQTAWIQTQYKKTFEKWSTVCIQQSFGTLSDLDIYRIVFFQKNSQRMTSDIL